jgi:hypothetical protein
VYCLNRTCCNDIFLDCRDSTESDLNNVADCEKREETEMNKEVRIQFSGRTNGLVKITVDGKDKDSQEIDGAENQKLFVSGFGEFGWNLSYDADGNLLKEWRRQTPTVVSFPEAESLESYEKRLSEMSEEFQATIDEKNDDLVNLVLLLRPLSLIPVLGRAAKEYLDSNYPLPQESEDADDDWE